MSNCLFCGSPERKFPSKFCNDCGNGWPAHQVVDKPADVHRYVESLYQSVQSSQFDAGTEKMIKKMRESFKISHATNERIMADLRERLKIVEEMHKFKLEFNQNDSDAYAEQDTLLQFRLSNNADGEQLKSVELTWDDPDSASGRAFRASSAMPVRPGATLSLQGSHVFMRFGPKSIDRMKLRVELPWGDVGEFILEAMVFNVRNADQKISKNITNNISMERGVLDNSNNFSDADGAPLSVGRQSIWKEISLYPKVQHPDDIQDLIEPQADQAETAPATTPTQTAEVAAEKPETQNTAAQNTAQEPDQARAEAATPAKPDITAPQETPPATAAVTQSKGRAAGNSLVSSQDPSACDDLRECAIQVLKSLAWFAQASPISKPNTVITSDQFDLDFLDTIYHVVPDAVEDAVLGMVFQDGESVEFDAHRCVTHFDQAAFVVTDFGIIQVKSDEEGDLIPEMTNSWSDAALAGWGFHARRFGDDKFVISFGDGSLSQTLPGCKFDLRRYQGEVPVTQALAEAQAWLQRLYDLSPVHESDDNSDTDALPTTQSTPTEAAWPFDSQEEEGGTNEFTEEEDSSEDEARAQTLNEISQRMQRFFGTFSFAMQRCDENQVRDIYIVDQIDPDLRNTLHEAVYFSGSGMLVVCVEPACALVNDSGLLVGWKGVASVLSAEGIFHMTAQTPGKFMLDGNNAFLSWTRFFDELKADLMVREEGPDLWFGTSMNHLIRGCYADYSSQVLQWDYFENYVHAELRKQLDLFRESLDWI